MATERGQQWELRNETAVNVAGLLKGQIGTARTYRLLLDDFAPDGETIAQKVTGKVRLTRLRDGILAHVEASGLSPLACARCLRDYEQPFEVAFDEEYRQTVDVRSGAGLDVELEDEEQASLIDENHELDLREPLRQEIVISLPMRPDCGPDCPGPDLPAAEDEDAEEVVDTRLAALATLLGNDKTTD
jgi:uncharacterized protein